MDDHWTEQQGIIHYRVSKPGYKLGNEIVKPLYIKIIPANGL